MEPWKIAAIAALGASIIGYGVFSNSSTNRDIIAGSTPTPAPSSVAAPPKYIGKTLPLWPSMTQWVNTPAPVNLPSLRGKPVLLEVFRTECPHCNDAAPFLVRLHGRYAPRGVQFVGVQSPGGFNDPENPENDWKTVQSWLKEKGYTWPVGFDAKSSWFQGKLGKNVSYPSLFLIDKNGKVVFFQSGHTVDKAIDLSVELEKIAPGKDNIAARAGDLSQFLAPGIGLGTDPNGQKSLTNDLAARLNGVAPAKAPQARASMFPPLALWLLGPPVAAGAWLYRRRTRTSQ